MSAVRFAIFFSLVLGTLDRAPQSALAADAVVRRAALASITAQDAKDYVSRIERKIILIDGHKLASLCIDFGVGVAEVTSYIVKRIDLDYFEEE